MANFYLGLGISFFRDQNQFLLNGNKTNTKIASIDPKSKQNKPNITTIYNLTKGDVDVVDRMKSEYSLSSVSNRWPFTVFDAMLNIATINSQIIFKSNTNVFS